MKIKGCRHPGFDGRFAMVRDQKRYSDPEIRAELEKIPGVRFEVRGGREVVTGLADLTENDIPANIHPAVRAILLRRIGGVRGD